MRGSMSRGHLSFYLFCPCSCLFVDCLSVLYLLAGGWLNSIHFKIDMQNGSSLKLGLCVSFSGRLAKASLQMSSTVVLHLVIKALPNNCSLGCKVPQVGLSFLSLAL